jgi:hypothetical protein
MPRNLAALYLVPALAALAAMAQAQSAYRVDYFVNANTVGAPDATLRLDNDGAAGAKNLCADIFVFDTNEELSECCSCLETPDGLRTLSVNSDLTANPLTGVILTGGVIKVVAAATSGGTCPVPYKITVAADAEIQAWATHIQNSSTVTETPSQVSSLSTAEAKKLAEQCGAIVASTGGGVCTCGTGTGS